MAIDIIDSDSNSPDPFHNVYAFPVAGQAPNIEHVRNGLESDVLPIIDAVVMLSESMRALYRFKAAAEQASGLREALRDACSDWCNATAVDDPWRVVANLARIAATRAEESARMADVLANASVRTAIDAQLTMIACEHGIPIEAVRTACSPR